MTPREIVQGLDSHIIGQDNAKRSVAIAIRNRWRRSQIQDDSLRTEIYPHNILMIGPTGVGKTEIARRLAQQTDAPFIKVEATKFTEVGYVGRDVESMVRDLVDSALKQAKESAIAKVKHLAEETAEERILDALLPQAQKDDGFADEPKIKETESTARQLFRKKLRNNKLEETEIEINVSVASVGVEIMAPPGMEEMTSQLQNMFQSLGSERTKRRRLKIEAARKLLYEEEANKLINDDEIKTHALKNVEENGIIFIDEIDKVTRRGEHGSGADVSREGVQRDLLPMVEGCTVFTKYGMIKTDHILFVASGAFHVSKPSDLIAELQGRFPIRVELNALTANDFERILTEPDASLTEQYVALMAIEGLKLKFTKGGIRRIAEIAYQINERTENIGARRLYTVMERLLETISFEATDRGGETITINKDYVNRQLNAFVEDEDLARWIL